MIKHHFNVESVNRNHLSELDFYLDELVPGFDCTKEEIELIGNWYPDGYPVNIQLFREFIDKLIEMGATHLTLQENSDNIGYDIEALRIEPTSLQLIEEINVKKAIKNSLSSRIEELLKQIEEIHQQLKELD